MAERRLTPRTLNIALFVLIAGVVTLIRLLPVHDLGLSAEMGNLDQSVPELPGLWARWPAPDLMLCLTLAWIVRRPDLLPAPLIAAYFLFEDLLLMRPPGAWALVVVLATEFLRTRTALLRGAGFWLEFVLVAGIMVAMWLGNRALLAIVIVPQVPLDLSFAQLVGSVILYPLVVGFVQVVLRLRKPAAGELDGMGQKL
jgi:rod shape-determining protein MreD